MSSSITVKHILALDFFKYYTVLAGETALNNSIRSVTIAETRDIAEYIPSGTMILTVLSQFTEEEPDSLSLSEWLVSLHHVGVSAVIVKTGRYVNKIPDPVLKLADRLTLPLIQAPDDMQPVHLINIVSRFLFQTESMEPVHAGNCLAFFRRCLDYPRLDLNEQNAFEMGAEINGYILSKPYHLLIYSDGEKEETLREQLFLRILLTLRDSDPLAFGARSNDQSILFFHAPLKGFGGSSAEISALPAIRQCNSLLEVNNLKLYTSKTLKGAEEISLAFYIIKSCISIDRSLRFYSPKSPVTYEKRMFLRMLDLVLQNHDFCREYVDVILMEPIRNETPQRQKEIRQFLRTIFRLDCRVKDIAAYTNTHPNTVQYRIQYIEKVYDCDLKDTRVQQTLQLALLLRSILKERENESVR